MTNSNITVEQALSQNRLLSAKEAAQYLGISEKTLYNWKCNGTHKDKLKYSKLGSMRNARLKFRLGDLDEFISNHKEN